MAALSIGNTSGTDTEKDICPLCLDPIPPVRWKLDCRRRNLCCGALICHDCVLSMVVRGQTAQKALDRGDVDDNVIANIEAVITYLRCPMCRSPLTMADEDSFAMLQSTVEQHPNWAWALYLMGECYEHGTGCPKDYEKAFFYYQKAAERGDVRAQNKTGNFYCHGNKGVAKSTQNAIYWYTLASNQGFASSQYTLGQIYFDQEKYDAAFRLFSLAAEQGADRAQCMLAICYQKGLGVVPSMDKLLYWNKQAADQGNTTAMNNYALFILTRASLANGVANVVGKNAVPEALYWARKAVSLGYEEAASLVTKLETAASQVCANCEETKEDNPAMKFSMCSQCKATAYCSKECQAAHWRKGHKWDCIDRNGVKKTKNTSRRGR